MSTRNEAVSAIGHANPRFNSYSGWWLLLAAIPVAGVVWLVWQTTFRRGVPQGNRWGEDPLRHHGDYLAVQ